jgi:Fe-S cluster assembly iron-binding protein IscA
MVNVTDRAKIELKNILSARVDETGVDETGIGLRLDASGQGGLALYPDREKAGDQVVEHEGNVLLLIGEEISQPLAGTTIDFKETPEGSRLVVTKGEVPPDGA